MQRIVGLRSKVLDDRVVMIEDLLQSFLLSEDTLKTSSFSSLMVNSLK